MILAQPYSKRLEGISRALKRSGETRLALRPFPNSSIEQPRNARTKLIALLEMTECLVQYVYVFWLGDEIRGRVQVSTWGTILGLAGMVRRAWRDTAVTERQKAMQGLMYVFRRPIAYVHCFVSILCLSPCFGSLILFGLSLCDANHQPRDLFMTPGRTMTHDLLPPQLIYLLSHDSISFNLSPVS